MLYRSKIEKLLYRISLYSLLIYAALSCTSQVGSRNILAIGLLSVTILVLLHPEYLIDFWRKNDKIVSGISLFFAALIISSFFSINILTSIKTTWNYLLWFAPFPLTAILVKNKCQFAVLLKLLSLSVFIASLHVAYQFLKDVPRAAAMNGDIMTLASIMAMIVPLLLVVMLEGEGLSTKEHVFVGVLFSMALFALYCSLTRGAWLAVLVCMIFYFFLAVYKYGILNKKILGFFLLTMVFLTTLYFTNSFFASRFNSAFSAKDQSSQERVYLWKSSWNILKDHPAVGTGPGTFGQVYESKYILPEAKVQGLDHAHNNFLNMLAEGGVLLGSAFIYMFFCVLQYCWQLRKSKPTGYFFTACFLAILGFLLHGLTEFNYSKVVAVRLLWFFVGIAVVAGTEWFSSDIKDRMQNIC